MPSSRWIRRIALMWLIGLISISSVWSQSKPVKRFEYYHDQMGTAFKLIFYAPLSKREAQQLADSAFAVINQCNDALSDYRSYSELNRLCLQADSQQWVAVSRLLYEVLDQSAHWHETSEGLFDISMGHLTKLYRRAIRRSELPDAQSIRSAHQRSGARQILLDPTTCAVSLNRRQMRLDLGGIAKGYSVQMAMDKLAQLGITQALLDGGGDIVIGDPPPEQQGWDIRSPIIHTDSAGKTWHLRNCAIATSGDAYQYLEIEGVRYSHIIHPTSGLPLTRSCQVTVVAPNGADADALATIFSLVSPEARFRFLEKPEIRSKVHSLYIQTETDDWIWHNRLPLEP
ncbi:FAD:protein FMN transferase [Pontibacter sp. G13]|uniref:FAD:protein FMN transferase n=1 Tax=Pontibacter sp. G13 TaxID=3074898 RepID=UPI00288AE88E|nr:FAD:protein FMN transferase [Pontibacter sp. G13]WNJ17506.1 FAD:protein FMN transferase [Pontibacter sp. G13]